MKKLVVCSLILFTLTMLSTGHAKADKPALFDISQSFDINHYQGKVVYLDFWASWCVPCRKSFPWMNQLRQKYSKDDLVIIAVNLDKKKSLATEFLAENPATFNIIYDPKGQLAKHFHIKGMPSSVIFDRNGKPVKAHTGFFVKKIAEYEQEIQNIINKRQETTGR
jgi:thiol-disulfide isomerase/thioredoxin